MNFSMQSLLANPCKMQSFILNVGEKLVPVSKESKFKEAGRLTPEEFVASGDYLVFKCPTWSWSSGDESKLKSWLPADKQFIVTKNVPAIVNNSQENLVTMESDDSFERVHFAAESASVNEIGLQKSDQSVCSLDSDDNIPDLDEFDEENLIVEEDPAQANPGENTFYSTHTFDLYITYDKFYQTARLWISGFDKNGVQMVPEAILDLLSQDHAHKTVTIEAFPHLNCNMATVHPCKHAQVMKKIMDLHCEKGRELRPDQYLILFLKFMSSIMPSIDYDHTMTME